jgi:starch synthase
VVDASPEHLQQGKATGIQFTAPTSEALWGAIDRSLQLYQQVPVWKRVITTAMRQDFSWKNSAQAYQDLYDQAIKDHD